MIETFFERSFAIDRLRKGFLGRHIDLLADRFSTQGFSRVHSRIQLRYIGHFNRWLDKKGFTAKQIDEEMIERFWHLFMRRKRVRRRDMSALFTLLEFLREQGVTPRRSIKAVLSPRESHVESYRS